jgi:hypothetical protein
VGFYARKSLSAGPFRFNLSTSGVGVSVGVPGFRVGTGPRGNYVHMGRGGVYYRATLNGRAAPAAQRPAQSYPAHDSFRPSGVLMEDVTGATALELAPTGGDDVVDQLNAAAARTAWGWWVTGAAVVLGLLTLTHDVVGQSGDVIHRGTGTCERCSDVEVALLCLRSQVAVSD